MGWTKKWLYHEQQSSLNFQLDFSDPPVMWGGQSLCKCPPSTFVICLEVPWGHLHKALPPHFIGRLENPKIQTESLNLLLVTIQVFLQLLCFWSWKPGDSYVWKLKLVQNNQSVNHLFTHVTLRGILHTRYNAQVFNRG